MNLQKIKELLKKQMPNASEEEIEATAKEMHEESRREEDRRATEASQAAVQNYEAKHGLKDGKAVGAEPAQTPKEPAQTDEGNPPAWAGKLIKGLEALTERVNTVEQSKVADSRRAKFEGVIGKLPSHLQKPYARVSYDTLSEEEFDKLMEEVGGDVDSILKAQKTQGAAFTPRASDGGGGGSDSGASKEEVDAILRSSPHFGKI